MVNGPPAQRWAVHERPTIGGIARVRLCLGNLECRRQQPRALSHAERAEVLGVLHEERFVDQAPATIYATLLDEGRYVCSVPTMYRVLRAEDEVRERRRQARHPATVKPELLATGPNRIWTWDITKLLGPEKWTYFHLYATDHRYL